MSRINSRRGDQLPVPNDQQFLRDLRWVVASPSLIEGAAAMPCSLDDVDLDHLASFVKAAPNFRVGRYFERLVLYYLRFVRNAVDVQDGCQVREGNRTIGEIDFMFTDEVHQRTHWEAAVKFYLHLPGENAIGSHYIGPNAADTFERKMDRIFGQQLPLSRVHFPDVTVREPLIRGRIFYHPLLGGPAKLPDRLAADHLRSAWMRASELDRLLKSGTSHQYRVLVKPYWLAEESGDGCSPTLTRSGLIEQLNRHFFDSDQPVLICQLRNADSGLMEESERVFVVSDRWPSQ
ncbi:MAG: DUF1853 family protein [Rubripirellula sp.]